MAEAAAFLLIAAALTTLTQPGRRTARKVFRRAYKATGWRTPRAAARHHGRRLGAAAGRRTRAAAGSAGRAVGRAARRAATAAGRRIEAAAARRWQARRASGTPAVVFWQPREPVGPGPADDGPGTTSTSVGDDQATDASQPGQAASDPGAATPGPVPEQSPTTAPHGAERSTRTMTSRYAINLEPPSTDGEFLESCVQLGDVLKALAGQVADWADSLSALNLPQSVLTPLHEVADGITDAATGAARAAAAFEDEFEDAREVASRGMTITGQDAA